MTAQGIIDRINAIRDNDAYTYETYAIRTQDVPFALGEVDHVSHVWNDGDDTGIELGGICAVLPEYYKAGYYYGEHVAILGCYYSEMGEDLGEVIMQDAVVLDIIS